MRLIIDIDDEMVCNDIKNKALEPTSETDEVIINALYNGTPYNPSGDLISREALKKCAIPCEIHNGALTDLCVPLYQIDNAPTVEPRIEFGTDGQPYRLFMSGGQVVPDTLHGWRYEERPQGEWTDLSTDGIHTGWIACSVCGQEPPNESNLRTDFCPNCGADMRGDVEE